MRGGGGQQPTIMEINTSYKPNSSVHKYLIRYEWLVNLS